MIKYCLKSWTRIILDEMAKIQRLLKDYTPKKIYEIKY